MIIFGTRGITTTPERGQFECPNCERSQQYSLKRVRRFFTLYFIPLIPLDKLGEYIECGVCNDTYKLNILDFDSSANAQAVEAEYHAGIKKIMIHMLLADGVIDDSEIDSIVEIYEQVTGKEIHRDLLVEEINVVQNTHEDLNDMLHDLQGLLNDEGKEMVVISAYHVAMADNEFHESEKDLLNRIAKGLGMTSAHLQGVIDSVQ